MIKKIWHDPVWSKVIAAIITAIPGLVAWVAQRLGGWAVTVTVSLWLLLLVTTPLVAIAIFFVRSAGTRSKTGLKPELIIDFEGDQFNIVHAEHKQGEKVVSLIYVRVRVRNVGAAVAKNCRVYLTALKEVPPGGVTTTSVLEDSKVLAWAGWKFAPIDVPPDGKYYADVLRISKHERGWSFSVESLFSHQQQVKNYVGTYRVSVMAAADNAASSSCELDVTYNGDWHSLRAPRVTVRAEV